MKQKPQFEHVQDVRALISAFPQIAVALAGINEKAARIILAAATDFLTARPNLRAHSEEFDQAIFPFWESVRYQPFEPGRTVESALNHAPLTVLRDVLLAFIAAGDLELTLRQQRDEINRQLDLIERRKLATV